jgi:septum formation protein
VLRVATAKAHAVERAEDEIVLAGDTTIAVGRRILGKPADEADLRRMLALLSGRRHHCLSALCVIGPDGKARTRVSDTVVAFKRLSDADIDWYVASGEGMGKAGGYAIQGKAEAFVRFLSGSHSGVVGLPVFEGRALLAASGYPLG